MGKVCEMCVLAGFTFPRTCRRPSFEFPPPPLRDCTLVRNEAHFDPPQKKVFLPAGIFPPCFRCLLSRANHEVTRRANTPAFPFVRHRETCYSQCCREIRWKPGQRKRVQPFRARNRDTLSLFLLFQHFAPHRLENSYNVFFPANIQKIRVRIFYYKYVATRVDAAQGDKMDRDRTYHDVTKRKYIYIYILFAGTGFRTDASRWFIASIPVKSRLFDKVIPFSLSEYENSNETPVQLSQKQAQVLFLKSRVG